MLPDEVTSALTRLRESYYRISDSTRFANFFVGAVYAEQRLQLYRAILHREPAGLAALRTLLGVDDEPHLGPQRATPASTARIEAERRQAGREMAKAAIGEALIDEQRKDGGA